MVKAGQKGTEGSCTYSHAIEQNTFLKSNLNREKAYALSV